MAWLPARRGIVWTVVSPVAVFVFLAAAMIVSVLLILTSRPLHTTSWPQVSLPVLPAGAKFRVSGRRV